MRSFGNRLGIGLVVALLMAAALGVLLVIIPGTGRIIQLRRTARRHTCIVEQQMHHPERLKLHLREHHTTRAP